VVDDYGLCSCQKSVHPVCEEDYILNPQACICKVKKVPKCYEGTYLIPTTAVCFGVHEPTCPKGFTRQGCKCVKNVDRECEKGVLTANGCKCQQYYPPTCSSGCTLNSASDNCICEKESE
jgi:hypothetical protein